MRHLIAKLKELEQRELKVVVSRGALALQQTQRNQAKSEIIEALYKDIKEAAEAEGYQVYYCGGPPEFLNLGRRRPSFKNGKRWRKRHLHWICFFQFDAIMKNLDTNGELDQEDYRITQEAKRKKRKRSKEPKSKNAERRRN